MCDADYGELAKVWVETKPKARKQHACQECGMPITVGTVYTRIGTFDQTWDTHRAHTECYALLRHIAFVVCEQDAVYLGVEPLRDRVREHQDYPEVILQWRKILRAYGIPPR